MRIIELKPRFSLEFSSSERSFVWRKLRKLGRPIRERLVTSDLLKLAGEEFILVDDWEECALISQSEAGDAILRAVFSGQRGRMPARDQRILTRKLRISSDAIERLTRQAA